MKFTFSFIRHCPVFALLLPAVFGAEPVILTHTATAPDLVTFTWQGGSGPYIVETSSDLIEWGDQGEPAADTNRTLAAARSGAFYRVRDLGAEAPLGPFHGLLETDQGEFGSPLGRHRLKSRWWLYKPQGTLSNVPATFFRQLIVHYQFLENGKVTTLVGPLESLGTVTTPGDGRTMALNWTRASGDTQRQFTLTIEFPYPVNTPRAAEPIPSDPYYELTCTYATPQPELTPFELTLGSTTTDAIGLIQLAPPESFEWMIRKYVVSHRGVDVDLNFRVGNYLWQGEPLWLLKTFILHEWIAPTLADGGAFPAFKIDSYFARTYFPGHHNFVETVLIEPAVDPSLDDVTRAALTAAAANIRYVYATKDLALGMFPDDIRLIGFDHSIRQP
jgi:hypothetical protein